MDLAYFRRMCAITPDVDPRRFSLFQTNLPGLDSCLQNWLDSQSDDDLLHAGRLTTDTAAAVVERRDGDHRRWVFLGPRLEIPQLDPYEGEVLIDQPGVRSLAFADRAQALAHFLRATLGTGAMMAQLGRRAPEMRHVRRWLGPIVHELDEPRRWIAGWFAVSAGGALFVSDANDDTRYRYIEMGTKRASACLYSG